MSFIRGIKRMVKKYTVTDIAKFVNNGKRNFQVSSLYFMFDNFGKADLKNTRTKRMYVHTKQPIDVAGHRCLTIYMLFMDLDNAIVTICFSNSREKKSSLN
ncbi:hypothetical protein WN55_06537 [Dufourea novaeangliae]|uniref:Uncharacterized protein n=1 Tax=Dufourea novaeangliae TaxID=178035 RepID=A0A154PQK2_DUFNO|nr:hypothetical protein WN55_06537 [Dufourea novaeangliae]